MDWVMIMACWENTVAFHNYRARISAKYEGFKEFTTDGKPANERLYSTFQKCSKTGNRFSAWLCRVLASLQGYANQSTDGFLAKN